MNEQALMDIAKALAFSFACRCEYDAAMEATGAR